MILRQQGTKSQTRSPFTGQFFFYFIILNKFSSTTSDNIFKIFSQ